MRTVFGRMALAARVDVKDHLLSYWFVAVLGGVLVYFAAVSGSQRTAAEVRVLFRDDAQTEASRRIIGRFLEQGYTLVPAPSGEPFETTARAVLDLRAHAALRFRGDGDVDAVYLTASAAAGVLDELEAAVEAERQEAAAEALEPRGGLEADFRLEVESVLRRVTRRSRTILMYALYALSGLAAVQVALAWLLGLETLPRLRRKYAAYELAGGKVLAAFATGLVLAAAFLGCLVAFLGEGELASIAGLGASLVLAVLQGVLFGLAVALVPSLVTRDRTGLLLAGSLLAVLSLFYTALFSGAILPVAYLPGPWRRVSEWLPFRQVAALGEHLALEGTPLFAEELREPLVRLAVGLAALFVAAVLLIRRH